MLELFIGLTGGIVLFIIGILALFNLHLFIEWLFESFT
jgi:hypothetical protein